MGFLDDAGNFFGKNKRTIDDIHSVLGFLGGPQADSENNPLTSGRMFNYRDHLLHLMSTQWGFGTPNTSLWLIFINDYPGCLTSKHYSHSVSGIERSRSPKGNDISRNVKELMRRDYQYTDAGCVFATSVNLPGEVLSTNYDTSLKMQRGFLRGMHTQGRQDFIPISVTFRETNRSFLDNIIRPWIVSASHHGFVARPGGTSDHRNVKTTVQVLQLGKTLSGSAPVNRKIHRFYNCTPISLETSMIGYETGEGPRDVTTQWGFTDYDIESLPDLPMELVFREFLGGTWGKLLNKIDPKGNVLKFVSKGGKIADGIEETAKGITSFGSPRHQPRHR
jgi:hypothetical protein